MSAEVFAEFLPDTSHRPLGDCFLIGLRNVRDEKGSDLSARVSNMTFNLYNSAGTAVTGIANTLLTLSGTTRMKGTYLLGTGSGRLLTAAGTYRAVYSVNLSDGQKKEFQQSIEVKSNPS